MVFTYSRQQEQISDPQYPITFIIYPIIQNLLENLTDQKIEHKDIDFMVFPITCQLMKLKPLLDRRSQENTKFLFLTLLMCIMMLSYITPLIFVCPTCQYQALTVNLLTGANLLSTDKIIIFLLVNFV